MTKSPASALGVFVTLAAVLSIGGQCVGMDAPWIGTKEGISDRVLVPWMPIKLHQETGSLTVDTWGRSYRFSRELFPSQIKTQGKDILVKPIRVNASVNGEQVSWKACSISVEESTPAKVMFTQRAVSSDGKLSLSAKTFIEYDGMVKVDWGLDPKTKLTLDNLTFEITLPGKYAKYFYNNTGRHYYPKDGAYVHVDTEDPSGTKTTCANW